MLVVTRLVFVAFEAMLVTRLVAFEAMLVTRLVAFEAMLVVTRLVFVISPLASHPFAFKSTPHRYLLKPSTKQHTILFLSKMNTFSAELFRSLEQHSPPCLVFSTPNDNGQFLIYNPLTNNISVRRGDTQLNHIFVYIVKLNGLEAMRVPQNDIETKQHLTWLIPGAAIVSYNDYTITLEHQGNYWHLNGLLPIESQFPFPYVPTQVQAQAQAPDTQDFWPNEKPIE